MFDRSKFYNAAQSTSTDISSLEVSEFTEAAIHYHRDASTNVRLLKRDKPRDKQVYNAQSCVVSSQTSPPKLEPKMSSRLAIPGNLPSKAKFVCEKTIAIQTIAEIPKTTDEQPCNSNNGVDASAVTRPSEFAPFKFQIPDIQVYNVSTPVPRNSLNRKLSNTKPKRRPSFLNSRVKRERVTKSRIPTVSIHTIQLPEELWTQMVSMKPTGKSHRSSSSKKAKPRNVDKGKAALAPPAPGRILHSQDGAHCSKAPYIGVLSKSKESILRSTSSMTMTMTNNKFEYCIDSSDTIRNISSLNFTSTKEYETGSLVMKATNIQITHQTDDNTIDSIANNATQTSQEVIVVPGSSKQQKGLQAKEVFDTQTFAPVSLPERTKKVSKRKYSDTSLAAKRNCNYTKNAIVCSNNRTRTRQFTKPNDPSGKMNKRPRSKSSGRSSDKSQTHQIVMKTVDPVIPIERSRNDNRGRSEFSRNKSKSPSRSVRSKSKIFPNIMEESILIKCTDINEHTSKDPDPGQPGVCYDFSEMVQTYSISRKSLLQSPSKLPDLIRKSSYSDASKELIASSISAIRKISERFERAEHRAMLNKSIANLKCWSVESRGIQPQQNKKVDILVGSSTVSFVKSATTQQSKNEIDACTSYHYTRSSKLVSHDKPVLNKPLMADECTSYSPEMDNDVFNETKCCQTPEYDCKPDTESIKINDLLDSTSRSSEHGSSMVQPVIIYHVDIACRNRHEATGNKETCTSKRKSFDEHEKHEIHEKHENHEGLENLEEVPQFSGKTFGTGCQKSTCKLREKGYRKKPTAPIQRIPGSGCHSCKAITPKIPSKHELPPPKKTHVKKEKEYLPRISVPHKLIPFNFKIIDAESADNRYKQELIERSAVKIRESSLTSELSLKPRHIRNSEFNRYSVSIASDDYESLTDDSEESLINRVVEKSILHAKNYKKSDDKPPQATEEMKTETLPETPLAPPAPKPKSESVASFHHHTASDRQRHQASTDSSDTRLLQKLEMSMKASRSERKETTPLQRTAASIEQLSGWTEKLETGLKQRDESRRHSLLKVGNEDVSLSGTPSTNPNESSADRKAKTPPHSPQIRIAAGKNQLCKMQNRACHRATCLNKCTSKNICAKPAPKCIVKARCGCKSALAANQKAKSPEHLTPNVSKVCDVPPSSNSCHSKSSSLKAKELRSVRTCVCKPKVVKSKPDQNAASPCETRKPSAAPAIVSAQIHPAPLAPQATVPSTHVISSPRLLTKTSSKKDTSVIQLKVTEDSITGVEQVTDSSYASPSGSISRLKPLNRLLPPLSPMVHQPPASKPALPERITERMQPLEQRGSRDSVESVDLYCYPKLCYARPQGVRKRILSYSKVSPSPKWEESVAKFDMPTEIGGEGQPTSLTNIAKIEDHPEPYILKQESAAALVQSKMCHPQIVAGATGNDKEHEVVPRQSNIENILEVTRLCPSTCRREQRDIHNQETIDVTGETASTVSPYSMRQKKKNICIIQ